jgi:hypothetical protein
MEKRINQLLEKYLIQFKDQIKEKVTHLEFEDKTKSNELLEFVYEYQRLQFTKDDFTKRKRLQNIIPDNNRCIAKKSCNEQCTRRRKDDSEYCGTHFKYASQAERTTPTGIKKVEVIAKEMEGIVYYVDEFQNVYRTEDILNEKENPKLVAKYEQLAGGRYILHDV